MKLQFFLTIFLTILLFSCNYNFIESYTKKYKRELKLNDKKFITSDGYTIAYSDNEVSNKPVLFFVHGYMVSRYNFFRLSKFFKEGDYRLILVDVPGFGESSKYPHGDYKITSQAKRLNELVNVLRLKDVNLVGTSMGGGICIAMNGMNNEIKTSTLIAPIGMPLYTEELPDILDNFFETGEAVFMVENPYNEERTKKLMHYATNLPAFILPRFILNEIKDVFENGRDATNKVGRDILYDASSALSVIKEHPHYSKKAQESKIDLKTVDTCSPTELIKLLNAVNKKGGVKKLDQIGVFYENVTPYLEKIDNPILVIWGTKDNIIHYKTMETMKPHIKKGFYKLLKNGPHSAVNSKPKYIATEMKFFLNYSNL